MASVKNKLIMMIGLTSVYFLVQFFASHFTHSLTLLTSSYRMMYNIMSLLFCVTSIKMSRSQPIRNTFGWARIEVLGMLMSILFLAALYFSVIVQALQTIVHADRQDAMHHPIVVLIIATFGILLNIICFSLLGGYTHEQGCFLLVQGKDVKVNIVMHQDDSLKKRKFSQHKETRCHLLLDFFRDISDCLMVMLCACIVYFFEEGIAVYADPICSIVSVLIILISSYPFVKQSGMILLQNIPDNIDIALLKEQLLQKFPQVLNVHDLHVWRLARNKIIATSHVICMSPKDYKNIAQQLTAFFQQEGITLVTIQPEFLQNDSGSPVQSMECINGCGKANAECQASFTEMLKLHPADSGSLRRRTVPVTNSEPEISELSSNRQSISDVVTVENENPTDLATAETNATETNATETNATETYATESTSDTESTSIEKSAETETMPMEKSAETETMPIERSAETETTSTEKSAEMVETSN